VSAESTASNVADLSVARGPLAGPVLGRVIAMLASRANLPLDRLNDAVLLGDAIAASADDYAKDGRISVQIEAGGAALAVRVGPLVEGGADELRRAADVPGAGNVIERLVDDIAVERHGDGEFLRLSFAAR
jgi:serine/threonine-protein kinase RsbW